MPSASAQDQSQRTRRYRVVHVVLQLETGGMEKLLVEFARHADRDRFELSFLSLSSCGRIGQEIEALGWSVRAMNEPPGLRPGMVLRLARQFRAWGADIVHTHNSKPMQYAAPAAKLARAKGVVHTRHGQRFAASENQTRLFRLTSRFVDRMACVSHDCAKLSTQEGLHAARVSTIHNGIDVDRFSYVGPNPDGPAVVVSRLSAEKDTETLVRALPLIVREHPGFRLEIAGDGPCMADLRRLAADLRIEPHLCFLGDVRDVAGLLGRASMFILPSRTEGISLTLLEAMARGLPCVATRVGGNPEVVEDGRTGILVPSQEPQSLAAAVGRLLADRALAREMGSAGRQRVETCFDVRRMVGDYEALYLDVLQHRALAKSTGTNTLVAASN